MSINTTDKIADTVETLVSNTNQAITTINNQLDVSVLNNLTTTNKNTIVDAINEINEKKIGSEKETINDLTTNNLKIESGENGDSIVYFYDTKNKNYIKLFWNNNIQKYQLSFPSGDIVDIANNLDIENIQKQIDNVTKLIDFNFNTNNQSLIIKQLPLEQIESYVGPVGEIIINSDEFGEIRVQDGHTVGGIIISGSLILNWQPNIKIKKNQCIYYNGGLYRAYDAHVSGEIFDNKLYEILAAYKKFLENITLTQETFILTLKDDITNVNEIDVNIDGKIIQKSDITIIDSRHIQLKEIVRKDSKIEITYYKSSNLINSTVIVNTFVTNVENTTTIELTEEVKSYMLVIDVNVENTSLLNSEWSIGDDNKSIIFKNPIKEIGTRIQVKYWKGVNISQNGISFIPTIENDILSWKNDGGLINPEPVELASKAWFGDTIVDTNTTQTITGTKTFNDLKVPTVELTNNSTTVANTQFVHDYIAENVSSGEVGDIIPSLDVKRKGALLCNGASISKTTYPKLFELLQYKYGGSGDNFNLPDLRGYYLAGAGSDIVGLGDKVSAGLPNITGTLNSRGKDSNGTFNGASGAFGGLSSQVGYTHGSSSAAGATMYNSVNFYASRSSSIYGSSTTVRPKSVGVNFFIIY